MRDDYLAVKRAAESGVTSYAHYAQAKEPWFLDAYRPGVGVGRLHRLATLGLMATTRCARLRRACDRR